MSEPPWVSVVVVTYDSERVRHTEPFEPDLHLDGSPAGDQEVWNQVVADRSQSASEHIVRTGAALFTSDVSAYVRRGTRFW